MRLNDRSLFHESEIVILTILRALDIHVRADIPEQPDRRRLIVYDDPINELQRGEIICSELFGEHGPIGSLIDEPIRGHADDETITLLRCKSEMMDMPWMNDVKAPMAMDKREITPTQIFPEFSE